MARVKGSLNYFIISFTEIPISANSSADLDHVPHSMVDLGLHCLPII